MKKTIIIEILLLFVTVLLLYFCGLYWDSVSSYIEIGVPYSEIREALNRCIVYAVLNTLASIATLTAIILIALKDLPVFKPIADKLTAHKEKRTQAKAERAEADKQARITELENELNELKNN